MLQIVRTTKDVTDNGETLSRSFSHVIPVLPPADVELDTAIQKRNYLQSLIKNKVLVPTTCTFFTDDWSDSAQKNIPKGSGIYTFDIVDSPTTVRKWFVHAEIVFDNYYNDEYTKNGSGDFYIGPFETQEEAIEAGSAWIIKNSYQFDEDEDGQDAPYDWQSNNFEYHYSTEGHGWSAEIVELEIITSTIV